MDAHRQIARRDARKEGDADEEPSGKELSDAQRAMKDAQRDLTSLSGPVPRAEAEEREREDVEDPRRDEVS